MKLHGNAALSLNKRRLLCRRVVDEGWSLSEAAAAAEVSERTAGKWVARFREEGEAGLLDRSSAPRMVHNATPEERVQVIAALRRLRFTGPEIAETLEMASSTVSAVLKRIGLGKLSRLEPPEPVRRYESNALASCCTSTSRSWAGSAPRAPGTGSPASPTGKAEQPGATMAQVAARPAGSTSTSASTTPPGSPTPRCSKTSGH
jgi:transposase